MISVPTFASSYSPNEACAGSDRPNCGACYDEGIIIDQDVYCDCPEGDKRMDSECAIVEKHMGYIS